MIDFLAFWSVAASVVAVWQGALHWMARGELARLDARIRDMQASDAARVLSERAAQVRRAERSAHVARHIEALRRSMPSQPRAEFWADA
jgi:hypothetical protein